jgi:multiple sugar transport system ATP-binding protein
MNFMEGELMKKNNGVFFNEENFQVRIPDEMVKEAESYIGGPIVLGIRPEDIYDKVYASNASPDNTITATVEVVEPMGSEAFLYLTTGKSPFIAKVDTHESVEVNQDIELVFDMNKSHLFDSNSGETII